MFSSIISLTLPAWIGLCPPLDQPSHPEAPAIRQAPLMAASQYEPVVFRLCNTDPVATAQAIRAALPSADPSSITAVVPSQQLIVATDSALREKIAQLIQQLDVPAIDGRSMRTFRLKHADTASVAENLAKAFEGLAPDRAPAARARVLSDKQANAVVVIGAHHDFDVAQGLVKNLDVPATPAAGIDRSPSRLLLTVFEVEGDAGQIAALSSESLMPHAESIASLQKALAGAGKARILYNFDQSIELGRGVSLSTAENRPYVSGTSQSTSGEKTQQVNYQNVGCKIDLKTGIDPATQAVHLVLKMDLTLVGESGVKVTDNRAARKYGTIQQECNGTVTAGRPLLLLSADSSDSDRPAIAHVTRVELKTPG